MARGHQKYPKSIKVERHLVGGDTLAVVAAPLGSVVALAAVAVVVELLEGADLKSSEKHSQNLEFCDHSQRNISLHYRGCC